MKPPVYTSTIVDNNPDVVELRAAVAAAWPQLKWRHHAIGALQAYLQEGAEEVRVHVWHPALLVPGAEDSGQMHDHRFTLKSHVLWGQIEHTEVRLTPSATGAWQAWQVQNARRGEAAPVLDAATAYDIELTTGWIRAGETYLFPERQFHRSRVEDLTVTVITKIAQTERPARILVPIGVTPRHMFTIAASLVARVSTAKILDQALAVISA